MKSTFRFAIAMGLMLSLAACSGNSIKVEPATWESLAEPGPWEVGEWNTLLWDSSRPTPPNGDYEGDSGRILATQVYYPVDAGTPPAGPEGQADTPVPPSSGGPFPVLGYAHGFTSSNQAARGLITHLVSHGYVVVAPNFPLSTGGAPGGPTVTDMHNQPGDLAFALQTIAARDTAPGDAIAAVMDMDRVGIVGLSLGGATVVIGAYHPTLQIPFAKAAVAHAPATCFFGPDFYQRAIPTMILAGDADELVPFTTAAQRSFEFAAHNATLVRLIGGTHIGMLGIGSATGPHADILIACAAVAEDIPSEGDARLERLAEGIQAGLDGNLMDPDSCTEGFCDNGFQHSMSGNRQLELTRVGTLAHFQATLRGHADAAAFIATTLGSSEDVEVRQK
ncbi:MAG: hypothetical protein VCC00_06050 [Deltaproteobacteria bacterium]